jgi:arsenite methyltransferase
MSGTASDAVREEVREVYAAAARAAADEEACGCGEGACCAPSPLYAAGRLAGVPSGAARASLGCGDPSSVADLHAGETVLDLGAGAGLDLLLSARRVGARGRVFGLDMTDEMLALARRNVEEAGARNVVLLRGRIEDVPLPAESVDVVISNCVVNLSPDKPAVLREVRRVLRPGGRVGIADIVADDGLSAEDRAARGGWAGCVAGALSRVEYLALMRDAGLEEAEVELTHEVADGMHGAIVRARRPAGSGAPVPDTRAGGCC